MCSRRQSLETRLKSPGWTTSVFCFRRKKKNPQLFARASIHLQKHGLNLDCAELFSEMHHRVGNCTAIAVDNQRSGSWVTVAASWYLHFWSQYAALEPGAPPLGSIATSGAPSSGPSNPRSQLPVVEKCYTWANQEEVFRSLCEWKKCRKLPLWVLNDHKLHTLQPLLDSYYWLINV